jgi:transcriptional antiterminator RfaH
MKWYVIQSKPRQEFRALENLQNQGFEVFLPINRVQKLQLAQIKIKEEPLFARYFFIRLEHETINWGLIRSTKGVCKLIRFGLESAPASVDDQVILFLKSKFDNQGSLKPLFEDQEKISIKSGPFRGQEVIPPQVN